MAFETLCEIVAVASILIKFGHDDILEHRPLFIAFLNELGITVNARKVTSASLFELTQDITNRQREQLISDFLVGHEPIYRKLAMVLDSNRMH
ncbi:anti-sigma factor [Acinetobacter phage Acj9]|uniref:AsiA anti-sigma 70 protein n=1 Tax=Acinetobacter phage Acj9 TaxID=760939 RepID=E5EQ30_9CAUD|nr:anti-sigma factor [Acinetobacter phage Acj9]ADG60146.1 AsiA anti-sigma 70 protein [Acinetobacter phage Acj9]